MADNNVTNRAKNSHYYKSVEHLKEVDVYRVLSLFDVTDPCIQHAVKKLLVPGRRGVKDRERDIQEAIQSLERWQHMRAEDSELESVNVNTEEL